MVISFTKFYYEPFVSYITSYDIGFIIPILWMRELPLSTCKDTLLGKDQPRIGNHEPLTESQQLLSIA